MEAAPQQYSFEYTMKHRDGPSVFVTTHDILKLKILNKTLVLEVLIGNNREHYIEVVYWDVEGAFIKLSDNNVRAARPDEIKLLKIES